MGSLQLGLSLSVATSKKFVCQPSKAEIVRIFCVSFCNIGNFTKCTIGANLNSLLIVLAVNTHSHTQRKDSKPAIRNFGEEEIVNWT